MEEGDAALSGQIFTIFSAERKCAEGCDRPEAGAVRGGRREEGGSTLLGSWNCSDKETKKIVKLLFAPSSESALCS